MARTRRAWSALSAPYRARLAKGGITKKKYERGDSLSKARGHAKTPEHPQDVIKHPTKYPEYMQKAARWQNEIQARKDAMFSARLKWNEDHSLRNIKTGWVEQDIPAPGIVRLKAALTMTDDQFEDHARLQDDPDWRFLWYH